MPEENDYINDYYTEPKQDTNKTSMWIEAIMSGLQFGRDNTLQNQALEQQRQKDLGVFLSRDYRGEYEDLFMILGLFAILSLVIFVVIKAN